jgi:hypothetical protein
VGPTAEERLGHRRAGVDRLAEHGQLGAGPVKLLGDGAGIIDIPGQAR